jgi:DNA mismatch repair protein MutH
LQLNRILFIPVGRNQRFVNINNRVLEKAFFWSPSDKELEIIKKEWSNYQKIVKEGVSIEKIPMNTKKGFKEVTSLPNESSTKIIHLRTHAQGSNDRDVDSFGTSIVKHSFWLNKKFVKKLIQNSLNS